MREPRLVELVKELRPPSPPEHRASAARSLSEHASLPAWCAEPLVDALEDDASYLEDWTDWDGTITGGTTHSAREYARAALLRMGAAAIEPLVRRAGDRQLLAQLVASASPDALAAQPPEILETEYASAAMHGLHGMSEEAAAAIPALEAYAKRNLKPHERQEAERLIKRIRHLSKTP